MRLLKLKPIILNQRIAFPVVLYKPIELLEQYFNKNTSLKPFRLQHKYEIRLSVNVTKVEKTKRMTYGRFGES